LLGAAGFREATLAGVFVGRFAGVLAGAFTAGLAGTVAGATLAAAGFATFGPAFAAGLAGDRFATDCFATDCFATDRLAMGFDAAGFFAVACFAGEVTAFATVSAAGFTGAESERLAAVGAVEAGGAAWRFAAVLVPATRRPLAC
jgi:hypothetical protein